MDHRAVADPFESRVGQHELRRRRAGGPGSGPERAEGDEDLVIARHRMGPVRGPLDAAGQRHKNPEWYTFSVDRDEDCDAESNPFCLPIAIRGTVLTMAVIPSSYLVIEGASDADKTLFPREETTHA